MATQRKIFAATAALAMVAVTDSSHTAGCFGQSGLGYCYVPLINGSDTNFSHPYVLTNPANGRSSTLPLLRLGAV